MWTGHATDPELRFRGASGGGLSALLAWLLQSGRVDAVLQTTAEPDNPIGKHAVVSRSRANIKGAAGSRYAPSAPLAALAEVLAGTERYAFVGKPCDVAALRALSAEDPRVTARIPYILSFFCAGVPSESGAREVLTALGTDPARTAAFRYRGQGWPGMATATAHDGTELQMSYHDSWGRILSRHVQHRCKICADGTRTAADLVCADAWESDSEGYPVFAERDGVSLIVARTTTGAEILEAAHATGALTAAPFDPAALAPIQPGQRNRRQALLARLAALWFLKLPVPDYRGLQLRTAARKNPIQANLKNFLGTLRRGLRTRFQS
jgi:coenzyme F420 hydrogenase subunit beta